jgi:hypothetical protein
MRILFSAVLLVGAASAGCGPPEEKFVRVAGRLKVGGKPLDRGQIGFIPDESRGTTHPQYSIGEVRPDGGYELVTNDKAGVRPGWYKVVAWVSAEPISPSPSYGPNGELRGVRWLVAAKYTKRETTDLTVEVVDNPAPGAYDFDLAPP